MNIKGVGIGRGVAVGPVIRMAAPLPDPSDAPRAETISAETEIARVEQYREGRVAQNQYVYQTSNK